MKSPRAGNNHSALKTRSNRLKDLQRVAHRAILRPLTRGGDMQTTWIDGRKMRDVAADFIKANERLSSFERLQIYNRQYWYRLLDCFGDDYPGLRAVIGEKRFDRLARAYLTDHPSQSFTLRNLGRLLVQFLQDHPELAGPRHKVALDMARFEWAQVEGFDNAARAPLSVDDLLGQDPKSLKLALQPHITLLGLGWPLDDYVLAVKKQNNSLRGEASNAMEADLSQRKRKKVSLPRPQRVWLAVHRYGNVLYYKRLSEPQFILLQALRDGKSLARACAVVIEFSKKPTNQGAFEIQNWFSTWTELGWFCKPANKGQK